MVACVFQVIFPRRLPLVPTLLCWVACLPGTEEAPGESNCSRDALTNPTAVWASLGAMLDGSKDRYFQDNEGNQDKLVPEGVEGRVGLQRQRARG